MKPPNEREIALRNMVERPVCGCEQCKAACLCKPGMLVPGDLHYILKKEVPNPKPGDLTAYLKKHFQASEGALVMSQGQLFRVPTIVPKLTADGCVYLKDGLCSIHDVAPFGCAYFTVCDKCDEQQQQELVHATTYHIMCSLVESNVFDSGYAGVWTSLDRAGCKAEPLAFRVAALNQKLDALKVA